MNVASEDWLTWPPQAGSHQAPSTLIFTDNKAGFGLTAFQLAFSCARSGEPSGSVCLKGESPACVTIVQCLPTPMV